MTSFHTSFHNYVALQHHERLLAEARHAALVRQARGVRRPSLGESVPARSEQVPQLEQLKAGSTIATWRSRVLRARVVRRSPVDAGG